MKRDFKNTFSAASNIKTFFCVPLKWAQGKLAAPHAKKEHHRCKFNLKGCVKAGANKQHQHPLFFTQRAIIYKGGLQIRAQHPVGASSATDSLLCVCWHLLYMEELQEEGLFGYNSAKPWPQSFGPGRASDAMHIKIPLGDAPQFQFVYYSHLLNICTLSRSAQPIIDCCGRIFNGQNKRY